MIVQGINALVGFCTTFWNAIQSLGGWCLDGLFLILKGAFYLVFDGILTAITTFFVAIPASIFSASLNWAGVPTQLIYVINQCGIPQALAILVTAITARMTINLIPAEFTRV